MLESVHTCTTLTCKRLGNGNDRGTDTSFNYIIISWRRNVLLDKFLKYPWYVDTLINCPYAYPIRGEVRIKDRGQQIIHCGSAISCNCIYIDSWRNFQVEKKEDTQLITSLFE
jgi:hypothetical protein